MRTLTAALLMILAGCAGNRPERHEVVIRGFRYEPQNLQVALGDTVVWTNQDLVPHTATQAQGQDTGPIAAGASGRWVVAKTGRYEYLCTYHPTMKGVVEVR